MFVLQAVSTTTQNKLDTFERDHIRPRRHEDRPAALPRLHRVRGVRLPPPISLLRARRTRTSGLRRAVRSSGYSNLRTARDPVRFLLPSRLPHSPLLSPLSRPPFISMTETASAALLRQQKEDWAEGKVQLEHVSRRRRKGPLRKGRSSATGNGRENSSQDGRTGPTRNGRKTPPQSRTKICHGPSRNGRKGPSRNRTKTLGRQKNNCGRDTRTPPCTSQ
mmetsp:Transcript_31754/g.72914  ORF Transcript_31754/g.72914 Transcript_31754/m.72914 type:complete len:220 (+) Transcript_31754:107-766(+)